MRQALLHDNVQPVVLRFLQQLLRQKAIVANFNFCAKVGVCYHCFSTVSFHVSKTSTAIMYQKIFLPLFGCSRDAAPSPSAMVLLKLSLSPSSVFGSITSITCCVLLFSLLSHCVSLWFCTIFGMCIGCLVVLCSCVVVVGGVGVVVVQHPSLVVCFCFLFFPIMYLLGFALSEKNSS